MVRCSLGACRDSTRRGPAWLSGAQLCTRACYPARGDGLVAVLAVPTVSSVGRVALRISERTVSRALPTGSRSLRLDLYGQGLRQEERNVGQQAHQASTAGPMAGAQGRWNAIAYSEDALRAKSTPLECTGSLLPWETSYPCSYGDG